LGDLFHIHQQDKENSDGNDNHRYDEGAPDILVFILVH